jgi:asparagine synthase (glutamine-hydrolysing)
MSVQPVFTYDIASGEMRRWRSPSQSESIARSGVLAMAGFVANRAALCTDLSQDAGDAEVIAAVWQRCGHCTAGTIFGDAAWIAYDHDQREVTAVRDRMGMHGVYHARHGEGIWLSLSLDALLACWPGRREVNPSAIVRQINAQPPADGETHYKNVFALERGCTLTLAAGAQQVRRYWQMRLLPELKLASDEAYAEAYRAVLFEVAREYAPAGRAAITLSSGMDSTSVAAALREAAPALDLIAMTWTSPELPDADESRYVREVAVKLDLPLHEVPGDQHWTLCHPEGVRTSRSTPFTLYYDDLWDAGHANIRDAGATTVFDGLSGDALFGANVFSYPDMLVEGRWLQLTRELRAHMRQTKSGITWPQAVRRMVVGPTARAVLPAALRRKPAPLAWLHPSHIELWRLTQNQPVARKGKPGRRMRHEFVADPFTAQVGGHYGTLANRFGLQPRHVLLDHRLVEFALRLPTDQTIRNGQRKTIMRNAMRGRLPDSVLDMWGKIVPTTISERGLREREQAKIWGYLTNMRAAEMGFVDEVALRSAYRDYVDNKTQNALFFYAVSLEDWLRRYF